MRFFSSRSNIIITFFFALMALLIGRLFFIAIVDGEEWKDLADQNTIKNLYTDAPRGEIYDRNGVLLATNIASYTVDLSMGDMDDKKMNEVVESLIEIFTRNGDTMSDNFPILLAEDGSFSYIYDQEIQDWLAAQGMPLDFTAKQAFDEIRRRNNISEGMDKYEAQQALIDMNIYPPISVKEFIFTKTSDKNAFLTKFQVEIDTPAKEAFAEIRKKYEIDKNKSDAEARQMMMLRYELTSQGYMKYLPAKIAQDVSKNTVIELGERSSELTGVSVITDSTRSYPMGNHASHILGYLGKISDADKEKYVKNLKYKPTDLIGLDGIEQSQESYLRGTDGVKKLQVNNAGEVIRQVGEETKAVKGKDIILSIDSRLQAVAEEALPKAIDAMHTGGTYQSQYTTYNYTKASPKASMGAAVVLDVKTGAPLAIANSQGYDPNLFAKGISTADWASLQAVNPRDPLSPAPLYNIAAKMAVQPGSIFKPITGIVGLEKGLNPNQKLQDKGYIEVGNQIYSCMQWNTYHGTHGFVDLYKALEVSCNYYFFDVATGKDWASGASLGYTSPISIDEITRYSKMFGLGEPTGIEIPESVISAPTGDTKLKASESYLRNWLISQSDYVFNEDILRDKTKLLENIDVIVSWTAENPSVATIEERMIDLGVKETEALSIAEECKYTYFNFAQWTVGDSFNIAIGQGETAFTPLQMANYLATLGNGGNLNKVSLLQAIEGVDTLAKPAPVKAEVTQEHLNDVLEGMRRVVADGSLKSVLADAPVPVAGKTGTAERSGYINPPDEVAYIKDNLYRINSKLSWDEVETEMNRIMVDFPAIYDNPNSAVRKAVRNLSGRNFNVNNIDAYKDTYDNFAWVVALAPADNPEIAVVSLVVQGDRSIVSGPIVKDLIAAYFDLKAQDEAAGKQPLDYQAFFDEN